MTRGARAQADIAALLRARNTLLWVVTREEQRVERAIVEAAGQAGYETRLWDSYSALTSAESKVVDASVTAPVGQPPLTPPGVLDFIRDTKARFVYVLRDFHAFNKDPFIMRALRTLTRSLQGAPRAEARAIVVLTPSGEVPPELAENAVVVDWPLPDRAEIAKLLDDIVSNLPEALKATAAPNGVRERAIDAAVGLSAKEAENCYARSLIVAKSIDPVLVAGEKKRVIARERVLTWYDPNPRGLDAIGGLDAFKAWALERKLAFSKEARAYGLPAPKGVFLLGPPGTGKSLAAKCIATALGVPLLKIDFGGLKSKFVGESEANVRKALATAEAVAPCVVWVDEIEKALGGATGPQGDGGVSADALGAFLTWMQEKQGSVFVVATSNDVRALPPELLRKGRFDELFFVDLPNPRERCEVVRAALVEHGRSPNDVDEWEVSGVTNGFTGAEIAALVPDALFAAFADGARAVTTQDVVKAARAVTPLSKTAADKIEGLREWAKGRARMASTTEEERTTAINAKREIDL
jgi:hypothetical protein